MGGFRECGGGGIREVFGNAKDGGSEPPPYGGYGRLREVGDVLLGTMYLNWPVLAFLWCYVNCGNLMLCVFLVGGAVGYGSLENVGADWGTSTHIDFSLGVM